MKKSGKESVSTAMSRTTNSEVYKFVIAGRYNRPAHEDDKPTHLLLNNGKYYIPLEKQMDFWQRYAKDIKLGIKHYICEQRTPEFKFHIDLDFFGFENVDPEYVLNVVTTIQEIVTDFYESDVDTTVIVLETETKKVVKHDQEMIKTGIHLIFPYVITHKQNCLLLRNAFIQKLSDKFGKREYYNTWEDVVDEAIYKGSGLRMVGSRKMTNCACKRKVPGCTDCIGGKIDEGRVYEPTYVLTNGKKNEELLYLIKDRFTEKVMMTSIVPQIIKETVEKVDDGKSNRTENKNFTEVIRLPAVHKMVIPEWFHESNFKFESAIRKNKRLGQILPSRAERSLVAEITSNFRKTTLDRRDPRVDAIQKYIRNGKNMPDVYTKISVIQMTHYDNGSEFYWVYPDTRFCLNRGEEHVSNRIYFHVSPYGIRQKCFCTCNTTVGRLFNVPCPNYQSLLMPIEDNSVLNKLFPNFKKVVKRPMVLDDPTKTLTENVKKLLYEKATNMVSKQNSIYGKNRKK